MKFFTAVQKTVDINTEPDKPDLFSFRLIPELHTFRPHNAALRQKFRRIERLTHQTA